MDLFVCGRNPLLSSSQPIACEKQDISCSNRCKFISSGQVCVEDPTDHSCLLVALRPTRVLSGRGVIEILSTDAQNILKISEDDGETNSTCLWSGDGRLGIDVSLKKLLTTEQELRIQNMWFVLPHADPIDVFDNRKLFPLGLLTRDGGIYVIEQQPPGLSELTSPSRHRPFLHAALGEEVTNGMGDTWPAVVFPEQPRTVYRLSTIDDLVAWLGGAIVMHRSTTFPSKVMNLIIGGDVRGTHCLASTAAGEVYIWGRASSSGMSCRSTLQDALVRDGTGGINHAVTTSQIPREQFPDHPTLSSLLRLDLPPIARLVAGPTIGAAVSRDGGLYVFSTRELHAEPHLKDLNDRDYDPSLALPPFVPSRTRLYTDIGVEDSSSSSKVAEVAVGRNHIVALLADGRVFTAGDGNYGQLGAWHKHVSPQPGHNYEQEEEEARKFSEAWQEVRFDEDRVDQKAPKVVGIGAGWESTLFLVQPASAPMTSIVAHP
ncbi:hypothetical protein VTN00DRAFT_2397 [Thermoascus crustaceus]|uniref:uncharacterized protein n=1 Tax=Thermoascus crustaceus TaxID=5088 RepID=UPI0037444F1B